MGLRNWYKKLFDSYPEPEVPQELGLKKEEDRLVYKAVADLTERLKPLGKEFAKQVANLSADNNISLKYVWHVLLSERELWPEMKEKYRHSLQWAITLSLIARASPPVRGWQHEIPEGDSEVVVDLLLLEFGGWAYAPLIYKKAHKVLKTVLDRYTPRFKKVFQSRYDDANTFSDSSIRAALLIEIVQQVALKNWRFDHGRFIYALFRHLGYSKHVPNPQT